MQENLEIFELIVKSSYNVQQYLYCYNDIDRRNQFFNRYKTFKMLIYNYNIFHITRHEALYFKVDFFLWYFLSTIH